MNCVQAIVAKSCIKKGHLISFFFSLAKIQLAKDLMKVDISLFSNCNLITKVR